MGAPAIGKTYISTKLSKKLGITSLVCTDVTRAVVRKYVDEEEYKELMTAAIVTKKEDVYNNEDLYVGDIYGFIKQAEQMRKAIEATLKSSSKEGVELLVIEGIHMFPSMMPELSKSYEILPLVFKLDDENIHFERMVLQGEERSKYKLQYKDRARAFQQFLIDEAKRYNVRLIENLDEEKVIDEITALGVQLGDIFKVLEK